MAGADGFGYRRLASPPHAARAWIVAVWATALLVAALAFSGPLVLGALALGLVGATAGAGGADRLAPRLRMLALVAVPIVAVNLLVSRNGLTVFARLGDLGPFGQGNLTVEALVYGALFALKVSILVLITSLASLAIDPDELLRGLRGLSFRSALTASLAVRMLPLLQADARRLAEAQRTRPDNPGAVRTKALLLGAVVGGSLDRAMDVAATLEVRGYAWHARARGHRFSLTTQRPLSRHDIAFLASAVAVALMVLAAKLWRLDSFTAYPLVHDPVSVATGVFCVAVLAAILAPFAARRGVES